MIVVNVPIAIATRLGSVTQGTMTALSHEHGVELIARNAEVTQPRRVAATFSARPLTTVARPRIAREAFNEQHATARATPLHFRVRVESGPSTHRSGAK